MRRAYHVRHCAGMRGVVLVLLCLIACKGKDAPPPAAGSATSGSAAGRATPQPAPVADAAVASDAAIDAAAAPDAATFTGPTLSNKGGLSTLGKLEWSKQDENATAAIIRKKIGLPGI